MTVEERLAELEKRMDMVEQITTPLIPLGPRPNFEELERERRETVKRLRLRLQRAGNRVD